MAETKVSCGGFYLDNETLIEEDGMLKVNDAVLNGKMPIVSYGEETEIVSTTTVSFSKDGDNDWYISAANPISGMTFNEDTLYKVTWDDVEYECFYQECSLLNGTGNGNYSVKCVGNSRIIENDVAYNTNATFLIAKHYKQSESNNIYILTTETGVSHTIKVVSVPLTITIIDPEYYETTTGGRPVVMRGSGNNSLIANMGAYASGKDASAFGSGSKATGAQSVAFGLVSVASGDQSAVFGTGCKATAYDAVATGIGTEATNYYTFATGYKSKATGGVAFAEGQQNTASGNMSHASGASTTASGTCSFASGNTTTASGKNAFSGGLGTIANHKSQSAFGEYNIADPSSEADDARGNYVEIVGNGTADNARSNARTLDWSGNEVLSGGLTVGSAGLTIGSTTITEAQLISLLTTLN